MKKWIVVLTVSLLLSICVVTVASAVTIFVPIWEGKPSEAFLVPLLKYKIVSYDNQGILTCPPDLTLPNGETQSVQIKEVDLPDYWTKLQIHICTGYSAIFVYGKNSLVDSAIEQYCTAIVTEDNGACIYVALLDESVTSIEQLQAMLGVSGTIPVATSTPAPTPTPEQTPEPTTPEPEDPTAEPTNPAPTETTPAEPTPSPEDTIHTVGALKYKLTGSTATVTGPKSKNAKKLSIPATIEVEGKNYQVTAIEASSFSGMKKLTTVEIGENVKDIGKAAFQNCIKLVTIKEGLGITIIGDSAFNGCKVLKTFPVMNKLQKIGASAFKGCVKLTKFTLGAKVKDIGKNCFNSCKSLKAIDVKTTKLNDNNVGAASFKGIHKTATFKCPKKKLKAYKELFIKKGAPKTCVFEY